MTAPALRCALMVATAALFVSFAQPALAATAKTPAPAAKPAATAPKAPARKSASPSSEDQPLSKGFDKALQKEKGGSSSSSGKSTSGGSGSSGSSSGGAGRMIIGLLLVLALIYGIHWLLKKYGQGKRSGLFPGGGAGDAIEVLATTPLAANRSLHLVRVGTELVLIGATEQSINQLGRVDGAQLAIAAGNTGNTEFHQQLQGALTGTRSSATGTDTDNTFLRRFVGNLQMMTAR